MEPGRTLLPLLVREIQADGLAGDGAGGASAVRAGLASTVKVRPAG